MLMLDKTKMKKDSSSSSDVPDHFLCSIRWVSKMLLYHDEATSSCTAAVVVVMHHTYSDTCSSWCLSFDHDHITDR